MKRRLSVSGLQVLLVASVALAAFGAPILFADSPRTVARIWRGRTLASKADEYEKYLNATGVTKIRATPGNLGVTVLRRADGDKVEFVVMSIWESIESVKNYAGADYQKAVLLPRDREYLTEVEPNVLHYEIVRDERK